MVFQQLIFIPILIKYFSWNDRESIQFSEHVIHLLIISSIWNLDPFQKDFSIHWFINTTRKKLIDQIFSVIFVHIVVKIKWILTNAVSKSSAKLQLTAKFGILIVALNSYLIAVVKMLYKSTNSSQGPSINDIFKMTISAWRNIKNIFSTPLFTFLKTKMLKFHSYTFLTGQGTGG